MDSPIKKCPGDKYVWLKGLSEKVHKVLEFKQASISVRSVHNSSYVATFEPRVLF
jgi:hypothetical protein